MKKIICLVCTVTLILGSAISAQAGSWKTWINKYYEAAMGKISTSKTGFTANIKDIGWMGCWGGQAHYKTTITKGKTYTLKFNIKSSKLDKYVWVKIGNDNGSKISFAKWIDCRKGQTISVKKTFKANVDTKYVSFGFGGDYGDRAGVRADKDAKVRYTYAPNKKLDGRLGPDSSAGHPTVITVSGLSIKLKDTKIKSPKINQGFLVLEKGEKTVVKLTGVKGKVKWTASNKKLIKITKKGKNKIKVKAKKTGLTTIIAKYKKKKYKCYVMIF